MNCKLITASAFPLLFLCNIGSAQKLTSDIPYVENGHERQVLDIYTSGSTVATQSPGTHGCRLELTDATTIVASSGKFRHEL